MQFLLTCCFNESQWGAIPAGERDRLMAEYGRWVGELKEQGTLLSGAKLDACASAVSVRRRAGQPLLVDGPFAETKEQVGGYHVLECRDRDEAVAHALRIPTLAAGGVVEVRPLLFAE
ncbi:MAG: YciI family protein [Pirellulales bacterium]